MQTNKLKVMELKMVCVSLFNFAGLCILPDLLQFCSIYDIGLGEVCVIVLLLNIAENNYFRQNS